MASEMSKETVQKAEGSKRAKGTTMGLRLTSSSMSFPTGSGSAAKSSGPGRTITKKDLIDQISDRTNIKRQDVKVTVQEFLEQVMNELQNGNRLEFRDFGVFEIKYRAPRVAQNPKTLQRVDVPAKRTVKFKIGRLMKQSLERKVEPPAVHTNGTHASAAAGQSLKSKAAQ